MSTEFSREPDVAIFFRCVGSYKSEFKIVSLDTIVPETHVWGCVDEFRELFGTYDDELGSLIKAVNDDADGWHVKLTIRKLDEEKFYDFLREFCKTRRLKFIEPPRVA